MQWDLRTLQLLNTSFLEDFHPSLSSSTCGRVRRVFAWAKLKFRRIGLDQKNKIQLVRYDGREDIAFKVNLRNFDTKRSLDRKNNCLWICIFLPPEGGGLGSVYSNRLGVLSGWIVKLAVLKLGAL